MTWLLYRLLDRALADSIIGDLEECASRRYPVSRTRGELWKWRQLLGIVIVAVAERSGEAICPQRDPLAHKPNGRLSRGLAALRQDAAHAARVLARHPGFSLAAVFTLALGIGCTTAIFSIVNALLIQPLPYDGADRIVRIEERHPPGESGEEPGATSSIEAMDAFELRDRSRTLSHVGVYAPTQHTMTVNGETVRVSGARVSASFFDMLHAQPALGRGFRTGDNLPGAEPGVILSYASWQRYFRGDPGILTRRALIDGELVTIAGVMSESFSFPDQRTEIWMPFVMGPVLAGRWPVIARVRDDSSIDAAREEIAALLADGQPERRSRIVVMQAKQALVANVKPALTVLMISVGLVLLIACTNVANLMVARAIGRQREMAVRHALGAGRWRLVRQALTESVLLSVLGGIAGVVLAAAIINVLQTIGVGLIRGDLEPALSIPRLDEVQIDRLALGFTVAVSVFVGTLFGLMPAIEQSRADAVDLLRSDRGAGFSLARGHSLRGILIVLQIAAAMILLVAAGLQIHSFVKVSTVDPGYDSSNLLTFQVLFPNDVAPATFADDLIAEVERLRGVRAAGYSGSLPMAGSIFISPVSRTPGMPRPGRGPAAGPTPEAADSRGVSRGFLSALGVRVIDGHGLATTAPSSGVREILINRALARSGYLGPEPIGQRVYAGGRLSEVVGIIDDVRQIGLEQPAAPQVFGLVSGGGPELYYAVRTTERPASQVPAIRQIVRRLAPDASLHNVATMDQIVSSSVARRRLYAVLMGAFAAIAATLAAVGLYAMVAYAVTRRTREIGIRVALGAAPGRVLLLIMRDASVLIAIGLLLGLLGALAVARSLASMLFELTPLDPATYAVVGIFFVIVSLGAAFAAARRATATDPVVALRSE